MTKPLPWQVDAVAAFGEAPQVCLIAAPDGAGADVFALALAEKMLRGDGGESEVSLENHPDFLCVRPEKNGAVKVEQARRVTAFCELTPTVAAVRVAVVVDAHRATAGAANALLKTLEDAPPNKRLLLVAPGRRYLAPTVASRCGLVAAPLPSAAQAAQWLQTEHGAPAQAAADALAYFGGRPVAALAALAHHETRRELGRHLARGADLNLAQAAQLALAPEWGIEALVDFMQKWGADGARAQRGLAPRYFAFAADFFAAAQGARWLDFYRSATAARAQAARPLNPPLFAQGLLRAYARAF